MLNSCLILVLLCFQISPSLDVTESGGNIYVKSRNDELKQLTSSGLDSAPRISSDGTEVLFVRKRPEHYELRIISLVGNSKDLLVWRESGEHAQPGGAASIIVDPQFSPDGKEIFFYSQPGNLGIIWRVGGAKGTAKVIAHSVITIQAPGETFEIVPSGKFKGDLIVQKDSEKLTEGRLFLFWLVDRDGGNVGIIGTSENDVEAFRDQY
jgi:Tol biopolymer transport system component